MAVSVAMLATLAAAQPAFAQPGAAAGETAFLRSFEGQFSGSGTHQSAGGASRSLSCEFKGDEQGSRLSLNGSCRAAAIFSATIRIELRYDPESKRYEGAFRESAGTVADLAGKRQGERLTLAFTETAESTRPDPPATLTITRRQDGIALTLRNTRPGEGQAIDLSLSKN
jgi:hypothetical protein